MAAPSASRPPWGRRLQSLVSTSGSVGGDLVSPFAAEVEVCKVRCWRLGAEGPWVLEALS
jgi:hypothetical protein